MAACAGQIEELVRGDEIDGDKRPEGTYFTGFSGGFALGKNDGIRFSAEFIGLWGATLTGEDGTPMALSLGLTLPIY